MQLGPAKQTEQGFTSITGFDVVEFSFSVTFSSENWRKGNLQEKYKDIKSDIVIVLSLLDGWVSRPHTYTNTP